MRLSREQATVKLDIDAGAERPTVRGLTKLLRRAGYRPVAMACAASPSGKGQHWWIHVSPRPRCAWEVVALEAMLGGDPFRCAMQMNRARVFAQVPKVMRDAWNVLYAADPRRQRRLTLPHIHSEG